MRAFGCSAKSRKLSAVGSPDELPKIDDRPPGLDPRDRGGERGAAGGFEDQAEATLRLVDAIDDLVGAAQMPAAFGAADDRGHMRARPCRDLHRHMADAPGRTGHQHPLPQQRRAVAQGAQRGQTGDRQGRRFLETDIVGQRRHPVRRRRRALRPAGVVGQSHHPRSGFGAAAVGRRL